MIDRKALKFSARGFISSARPSPWTVALIACAITELLAVLSFQISGKAQMVQAAVEYVQTQNIDQYMHAVAAAQPGFLRMLVNVLLSAMSLMISTGLTIFVIRTVRDGKGSVGNLLDGFAILFRLIGYTLISSIMIFFWSLLLIIPGIIAALRYSQGIYLLLDHPEMTVFDCIQVSGEMMNGHKMERFELAFSFVGWLFSVSMLSTVLGMFLPLLVVELLVLPLSAFVTIYLGFTFFLYYEALQGRYYDPRVPAAERILPNDEEL